MKAYHCYEQLYTPHPWYEIELLVQLLSVWYWKKNGGTIGIYTEEKHLSVLEKYGIDKEYDTVDHKELKRNLNVNRERFWAISKIQSQLTILEEEYVILDTDSFFRELPELHEAVSFTAMHNEHHLTERGLSVYPEIEKLFPPKLIQKFSRTKEIMPVNTCFLHVRDKELISEWVGTAIEIANWMSKREKIEGEMMTVEQRLLPMLAETQGKLYSTLVENIYLPGYESEGTGNEWHPHPKSGGNVVETGRFFFHLWGFKRQLYEPVLRENVMHALISDINLNFPDKYGQLEEKFPSLRQYFNNNKTNNKT